MTTQLQEIANEVGAILKKREETIAIAESSSGGLISASLLSVPGASKYFTGGSVVYTANARKLYLDIDLKEHTGIRSATEQYAALIAKESRKKLQATWGLAETGAAGPTRNSYGDAPGHTCIAISGESINFETTVETRETNREINMYSFAEIALENLRNVLKDVQ
ncbi:MAG: CinA family protein [SAR202 cluster bacterium]|nr:CinA family protein [SAR202 cluster bacterium]|tara:strand:+ start:73 stop:567 length:495 start_codon:yes stop_codon:yes gene_type:complete